MGGTSTGGGPKVSLANPITGEEGALPALKRGFHILDLCSQSKRESTRGKLGSGRAMQQSGRMRTRVPC